LASVWLLVWRVSFGQFWKSAGANSIAMVSANVLNKNQEGVIHMPLYCFRWFVDVRITHPTEHICWGPGEGGGGGGQYAFSHDIMTPKEVGG
jgi:hypothetical protein